MDLQQCGIPLLKGQGVYSVHNQTTSAACPLVARFERNVKFFDAGLYNELRLIICWFNFKMLDGEMRFRPVQRIIITLESPSTGNMSIENRSLSDSLVLATLKHDNRCG